ncbi:hypothetical protein ACH40E_43755 [Streptomyces acidicola]
MQSAAEPTGWSDNATTETLTGNIRMEREPEVAYYRALFGQDFGVVG